MTRMVDTNLKTINIVIPVFNESGNLQKLVAALDLVGHNEPGYRWHYIFVNDGSRDNTADILRGLSAARTDIGVIDLARNFGKEIALTAGVSESIADATICIDADLQHPPVLIPSMLRAWENGAEIVATVRRGTENQTMVRKMGSRLFYYLLLRMSTLETRANTTDFRLLDRKVVREFHRVGEKKRMFRATVDWLGFKKVWLEFDAPDRFSGTSTFSMRGLLNLASDSLVSYSAAPLKLIGISGVLITFLSVVLMIAMIAFQLLDPTRLNIRPLAIVTVFNTMLIGVVLSAMGLMSMYINKIYSEVIDRPLYMVRERIQVPQ